MARRIFRGRKAPLAQHFRGGGPAALLVRTLRRGGRVVRCPSGVCDPGYVRRPQGGGRDRRGSDQPREEVEPFVHRTEAWASGRKGGGTREEETCRRFCGKPLREEVKGFRKETYLP